MSGNHFGSAYVGVQVIQADVLHVVVTLRIRQRIVGLTEVPFAREIGVVVRQFQHRRESPFRVREPTALALERNRGHAAAIGVATRLQCGTARCTAWLAVEVIEGHAFVGESVQVRGGNSPAFSTAVCTEVAPSDIVPDDQHDVGLRRLLRVRLRVSVDRNTQQAGRQKREWRARDRCGQSCKAARKLHGFP